MKNIYLNTGTITEVFNQLETSFNGVLNSNNNEFKLNLNSDLIKGNIDGVTFINGITSIQVNLTFTDDVMLSVESLSKSTVLFAYCTEGYIQHSFGVSGHKSTLRKHHSAVVTSNRKINTILHFKKNIPLKFSLIKVETEVKMGTVNDPIISILKKTFLNKRANHIYQVVQNLRIAEKFKQFNSVTDQGMIGHIKKKDIMQSILTNEVDAHTDNLIKLSRAIKLSAVNQIIELKKITASLKHNLVEAIHSKLTHVKNNI